MVGEVAGAGAGGGMSKVVHEGWMVRYGRRKIGKSYFHTRYFVLDPTTLAYYKKKPTDNMVPLKTLVIDGNCRVEDRGLKTQQGHMVYVLCIYNKKENHHRMMMAAYNIQDALSWKEKIEFVIDQQHGSMISTNDPPSFVSRELEMNIERNASSSSPERIPEDEEEKKPILGHRTSIGNSPPDIIHDWTFDTNSPRKNWQLVRCQNGLRIFEELLEVDYLPRSYSKAMKAVGAVDATCEAIFELIMSLDGTRYEWDCSFQYGSLVEEVDGHTAVLYQRLQLHWCSMVAWPRDLCYVRYWRRNDDGSYVVLFRSRVHPNCGPQPGFVRAHIESGGFKISPLKSRNGRAHTQVQYLMQIDLRGWFIRYFPSFQQHCLLQMLNCVAGIRELFSQTDEINTKSRIPIMVSVTSISSSKVQRTQEISIRPGQSLDQVFTENRQPIILDDDSDDDDDNQLPEAEEEGDPTKAGNNTKRTDLDEDTSNSFDTSCFSGNLRRDDDDNSRNCWRVPDGNIFKIRGANFFKDKSKKEIAKGLTSKHFGKDTCRKLSHGVRSSRLVEKHKKNGPCCSSTRLCSPSCFRERTIFSGYKSASLRFRFVLSSTNKTYYSDESSNINKLRKIPGSTHYSMVFYYVKKHLEQGSLLQRFVDGDDEFRNSRFKLIPSVPKGSWIVRQSVGNTPCLLGKAVDCSYIRGENYLEIDVDIGSSAVANGVLGLVFGVLTSLVVDMAFLIQQSLFKHCCSFVGPIAFLYMLRSMIKLVLHRVLEIELAVTPEELPERLVGAARVAHVELSSADFVDLAESPSEE